MVQSLLFIRKKLKVVAATSPEKPTPTKPVEGATLDKKHTEFRKDYSNNDGWAYEPSRN